MTAAAVRGRLQKDDSWCRGTAREIQADAGATFGNALVREVIGESLGLQEPPALVSVHSHRLAFFLKVIHDRVIKGGTLPVCLRVVPGQFSVRYVCIPWLHGVS